MTEQLTITDTLDATVKALVARNRERDEDLVDFWMDFFRVTQVMLAEIDDERRRLEIDDD